MRPTRPSSDGARDEIVAKTSGEALELLVVHFFTCTGPNIPMRPIPLYRLLFGLCVGLFPFCIQICTMCSEICIMNFD